MAQLYRKAALERMSSPEQTDRVMKISSPMSWLALVGITAIIVVTIIWAFAGRIPLTVSGKGLLASPNSTNAVFIDETGTVVSVVARKGLKINMGDPVLTYRTSGDEIRTLTSTQVGTVSEVLVNAGDVVKQGSETIRISPNVSSRQVAVCYIDLANSKKLERGMTVQVYMDSVNSQTHGHMWGRVVNIDSHASTTGGLYYVLGEGNTLADQFLKNGAVLAVTCELYPDDSTVSGYQWTNEKGKDIAVTNGSPINVKIIVEEIRPIEKMFSKIKEIWGD